MPAGCDFVCKNKDCEQFNKGFVINGPWPIGQIELIISSMQIGKNTELREFLIKQKNSGRTTALIQFPNLDYIPILGYRVSVWSQDAKCIWQYDIELKGRKLAIAVQEEMSGKKCPKTGCDLMTLNEAAEKGIGCPYCGEKMQQNRWFANEY